ncbi:MAG: hypothetical protein ACREQZ_04310 [Woeseiaceae bacterium]
MSIKQSDHQFLCSYGLTDEEWWGASLRARFAREFPEQYDRYFHAAARQNGDPIKRMTGYIQRYLKKHAARGVEAYTYR